jgi:hypothetical protein
VSVILQTIADSEELGGFSSKICPESSHEACQAISIKTGKTADAEGKEDPVLFSFTGLKAGNEVSRVSLNIFEGIQISVMAFYCSVILH